LPKNIEKTSKLGSKMEQKSAKFCSGRLLEKTEKSGLEKCSNLGATGPKTESKNEAKIVKNPSPGTLGSPGCPRGRDFLDFGSNLAPFWHHFGSDFGGNRVISCKVFGP